jgi:uncharacterized protein YgbK (DUF1537 family)
LIIASIKDEFMIIRDLPLEQTLAQLPPEWPQELFPQVQSQVKTSSEKVVVLDDDPTGTQTVHGVPVLTNWTVEALCREFENDLPAVFLLTNSRSLLLPEAEALNIEIGQNLVKAAAMTGRRFVVISRSDSTLRGHFPGEVQALAEGLQQDFDAWTLIPFFLQGGRYTINNIHYVAEGELLIPAGMTQFAQDATFGYQASDLRQWVAEKSGGRIAAGKVAVISLEDIRSGGPDRVKEQMLNLQGNTVCVVNAVSMQDITVFTAGLLKARTLGGRYLHRTAASFVPVRAGIATRPLLTRKELELPDTGGGLFVIGSYVPKTTTQVSYLLDADDVTAIEIDVQRLLAESERMAEISRVIAEVDRSLSGGKDVAIYTSRKLITGADASQSLLIGQRVSAALVAIVQGISVRPRYLLAKGGITSSDVAVKGLNVRRAMVLGQILPGVPVWQTKEESRFPGLTYIVFPGNVGGPEAVAHIQRTLKSS